MKVSRNIAVALLIVAPAPALSVTPTSPAVRAACTPDAKRLCHDVIGDPEKRRACMVQHSAQLSENCKSAIAADRRAKAAAKTKEAPAEKEEPK